MNSNSRIKFSRYYGISKKLLDNEGFFDICLISDLSLFIDPFHLFYSEKKEYQNLHNEVIKYLIFLKQISEEYRGKELPRRIIESYYKFPEVKQNWFGFTFFGNEGRGLGRKFANALNNNFIEFFRDFGSGKKSHHLEKLTLIADRVGKDSISDFVTNLIHGFLADKTQIFAKKNINQKFLKEFTIKRAEFDYQYQVWKPKKYLLPTLDGDYVLLTPKDLLTKSETWINKGDFISGFSEIPNATSDEVLREQLSRYLHSKLEEYAKSRINKDGKLEHYQTHETRSQAVLDTVKEFPESIDVYIKLKEERGDEAEKISKELVQETEQVFENQFTNFIQAIKTNGATPTSYEEALARAQYFKECIELHDLYKNLYIGDKPVDEDWIQRMFWFVWFGANSDLNRHPDNGLGEPDFSASIGKKDKALIEFKLAKSSSLEKNISKQLEKYKQVNRTKKGIWVIIYFNEKECDKINRILKKLNLQNEENYILVDARKDNKKPASKL
jgi:hypothetical protein